MSFFSNALRFYEVATRSSKTFYKNGGKRHCRLLYFEKYKVREEPPPFVIRLSDQASWVFPTAAGPNRRATFGLECLHYVSFASL